MADLIIAVVLLMIIGGAVAYIVKAKKNGAKCIGCPAGGNCSGKSNGQSDCSCSCGCGSDAVLKKE